MSRTAKQRMLGELPIELAGGLALLDRGKGATSLAKKLA